MCLYWLCGAAACIWFNFWVVCCSKLSSGCWVLSFYLLVLLNVSYCGKGYHRCLGNISFFYNKNLKIYFPPMTLSCSSYDFSRI